ncbi:MAG: flavin reductase family protein [Alphaproteobacteria bacterium]
MSKTMWKAGTMLYPIPPALISCGDMEKPNVLTIAWTGIINSDPAMTYISVRPSRFSHKIITNTKEFVINLPNESLLRAVDYCGVKSGEKFDKFKDMQLTPEKSNIINTPMIAESPLSLECRVKDIITLGSHDMFLSEIVAVNVDESLIDKKGVFHIEKSKLVAFCHGQYFALGRRLGKLGFSVKKKKKNNKK